MFPCLWLGSIQITIEINLLVGRELGNLTVRTPSIVSWTRAAVNEAAQRPSYAKHARLQLPLANFDG